MNSNIIERLRRWTGGPGRLVLWSIQCLIPSEGSSPWCQVEGLKSRQQISQGIKSKKRWVTTEKDRIYQPCNLPAFSGCTWLYDVYSCESCDSSSLFHQIKYLTLIETFLKVYLEKKTFFISLLDILNSVNVTHKLNFFHKIFQESARWLSALRCLQYKPSDLAFVPGADIKMTGENQSPNVDHTQ